MFVAFMMILVSCVWRCSWTGEPFGKNVLSIVTAAMGFFAFYLVIHARSFSAGLYYLLLLTGTIFICRYILGYRPKTEIPEGESLGQLLFRDMLNDLFSMPTKIGAVIARNYQHKTLGEIKAEIAEKFGALETLGEPGRKDAAPTPDSEASDVDAPRAAAGYEVSPNEMRANRRITKKYGSKNYGNYRKTSLASLGSSALIWLTVLALLGGVSLALYAYVDPNGADAVFRIIDDALRRSFP